jgi:hypothetical protein
MRNSQFKIMSKTGATLLGPVNNNCMFAGTNEVQAVGLSGYTADGAAYRLHHDGAQSAPFVRGTNHHDTPAGIQNALQGGNEVQQVTFANFNAATPGNTFRVKIGDRMTGAPTAPRHPR